MNRNRIVLYVILVIFFTLFNFYFRPISGNPLMTSEYRKSDAYINELYVSDEYFKKNVLDKDAYYVYDELIKASLEDKYSISIPCTENCQSKLLESYYTLYLDHPELISFVGLNQYRVDGGEISFNNYGNLDKIRYFFGVRRIAREIDIIKRETKNMTDKEKIIYVYDYVASHQYDRTFTFTKTNQTPYSFFTGGNSVCAGFAKSAQLIFQNIGIKSYLVLTSTHMWNYVEYNGKYYIFDATMGASLYDKSNPHFYDGLGKTTIGNTTGLYNDLYPPIEKTMLKNVFDL